MDLLNGPGTAALPPEYVDEQRMLLFDGIPLDTGGRVRAVLREEADTQPLNPWFKLLIQTIDEQPYLP